MKKIFTILGVAALAFTANAQQANLVQNPGFEQGIAPWKGGTGKGYSDPQLITSDKHSGNSSAGYENPSETTGFYQNVAVQAGKTYTISFWYKTEGSKASLARLWSVYKDGSNKTVYTTSDAKEDAFRTYNKYLENTNGTWVQHTATMPAGAGAVSLDVAVRAYGAASKAYFDDFLVVEGALATSEVGISRHALIKNTVVADELTFAAKSSIEILDMSGKVVKTAEVTDGFNLNVSSLPKGTYIVKGLANGETSVQKFVKK